MKQNFKILLLSALGFIANIAFAKTTSYNGSTWSNGAPAGSSDVVTITGGTYTLPANITYSSLTLNGGNFNTGGHTFGVTNVTLTNGTFTGSANQTFSGTLTVNGGTYTLGSTTRTLTVGNLSVTSGTLTLPSNLTVNTTATLNGGSLNANGRTLTLNNLTMTNNGSLTIDGLTVNVNGNISITGNSTISSNGTGMLDATGSTLTINGGTLTLDNAELVIDNLTFSSNHDINGTNGGFLSFDASSIHNLSSVDNSSHVNAKVRLYTANGNSNTFLFPIGNGNVYAPFIIDPTNVPNNGTSFTHYFEATYVGSASPNKTLDLTTLNTASGYEYWIANASSSNVNGTIGLRYDNNSAKTGLSVVNSVSNISTDLILAQYVNSQWSGMSSTNSTTSNITTVLSSSNTISPNTSYTLASNNARTGFIVPLPVVLINFKAMTQAGNKAVDITWETVTEDNNNYFEVMKSTDGFNWTSIGVVQGTGNKNELSHYSLTDAQPYSVNYYRLKSVSINGDAGYSDIRVARVTGLEAKISFYPNPANEILNVSCANLDLSNEVSIQLINMSGQVVYENKIDNMFATSYFTSVNIASLPAGVYQVNIAGATVAISQKLIINH